MSLTPINGTDYLCNSLIDFGTLLSLFLFGTRGQRTRIRWFKRWEPDTKHDLDFTVPWVRELRVEISDLITVPGQQKVDWLEQVQSLVLPPYQTTGLKKGRGHNFLKYFLTLMC